jgi:nicotinamide-nucleotide amidase
MTEPVHDFPALEEKKRAMRIEIICTGDEVLTGKIVNTNFSYMSQKLEDVGLAVHWETTVGDNREELLRAFQLAGERADAVIVNGGLGPTVDDLSQEIAAQAAGVSLQLNEGWLARMEEMFQRRGRVMPPNNRKQAMLPVSAEMIDNPVGTACGFAIDIGKARFFFTPGVPRELHRMLEEQIIPRLLARSGQQTAIYLKRFHSYGLGESHVDAMLKGVEDIVSDGSVKLGFRAHYPQLETKLTARGANMEDIRSKLAPVIQEVRKRMGNFILAEDDATLEGVVLAQLLAQQASLAVVETFTGGQIAARLVPQPQAETVFRRGIVARELTEVYRAVGLHDTPPVTALTTETAEAVATAVRQQTGATHALAVLVATEDGADRIDFGGTICLGIATASGVASRQSRIVGGREWVRLGAVEMGLDCLRRYLQGLPLHERTDFERTDDKR